MKNKHVEKIAIDPNDLPPKMDLFLGEEMVCIMCGKKQLSHPRVKSDWRAIQLDTDVFYACPDHFPKDKGATKKDFEDAYRWVLIKAHQLYRERHNMA